MRSFVDRVADLATRFPGGVLVGLFAATVVLGVFAAEQQFEADMQAFVPEGELQQLEHLTGLGLLGITLELLRRRVTPPP